MAEQRNQRQVDAIREERIARLGSIQQNVSLGNPTFFSSRGPRPDGDNIPEALQCVVCLGAEREVNYQHFSQ